MVWSSHEEVQSLLNKFYQVPKMERNKKSMKLETYYKEKASKLRYQLKKQTRKTKEVKDWLNENINANDIRSKVRTLRAPMPPFGHDSSSSVLIRNQELPTFETFSKVLLKCDNLGHCPLGPVESNSLASDFLGNLLRFLVVQTRVMAP
ncbi:hypothetical protein PVK06_019814 [Gossypium arboreum]|uniref:Uncharacterized protein n=1 Tax=Gossypium arboreum TaxID=29729 RepID=A0ABR0PKS9_GOSAR|nr:hypothetical protein PVK06_019814 [Gossypium arboreum]